VTEQHDRALKLLQEHVPELDRVAKALLEYETLTGEEVESLFNGGALDRRTPRVQPTAPKPEEDQAAKKRRRPSLLPPIVGKKDPDPEPA
jgi:cell division protease FtsH